VQTAQSALAVLDTKPPGKGTEAAEAARMKSVRCSSGAMNCLKGTTFPDRFTKTSPCQIAERAYFSPPLVWSMALWLCTPAPLAWGVWNSWPSTEQLQP
jgi:hypothetical protein